MAKIFLNTNELVKTIIENYSDDNTKLVIYNGLRSEILFESNGKDTPDGWLYERATSFSKIGNRLEIVLDMPCWWFSDMAENIYKYFNDYNEESETKAKEVNELETALKTVFKLSANDRNMKTLYNMLEMLNERAKDW